MNDLVAKPAVLRATIHVTRAGTGKVDTYELVGTPMPADVSAPDEPSADCPHAAPFRYCPSCVADPCPIGLGRKE